MNKLLVGSFAQYTVNHSWRANNIQHAGADTFHELKNCIMFDARNVI